MKKKEGNKNTPYDKLKMDIACKVTTLHMLACLKTGMAAKIKHVFWCYKKIEQIVLNLR